MSDEYDLQIDARTEDWLRRQAAMEEPKQDYDLESPSDMDNDDFEEITLSDLAGDFPAEVSPADLITDEEDIEDLGNDSLLWGPDE